MRGLSKLRALHQQTGHLAPTQKCLSLSTAAVKTDGQNNGSGGSQEEGGSQRVMQSLAAAAAVAAVAAALNDRCSVYAKEDHEEQDHVKSDNRVRQFHTPDMVFNYFASYRKRNTSDQKHGVTSSRSRWAMMMSPMDLYTALTPDCSRFGLGAGVHEEITEEAINSGSVMKKKKEQSPVKNSVLNKIGATGLLSYADFCVLLALLSTPKRYTDTIFNVLDVDGSQKIGVKEFAYVSSKMALKSGGFGSYTDQDQKEVLASSSGLLNYLFGVNRDQEVSKEEFKKLQIDLLNELIELQFLEYDKENTGVITELDFAQFLLKNGKIPKKKKASMIKNVKSQWPSKAKGVTLQEFKDFFAILASGGELERALYYLDVEGSGVDQAEFRKISSWVSGTEISDHIVDIIFTLLDDDGDRRLQKAEISQVLIDWRNSRGYDKVNLLPMMA